MRLSAALEQGQQVHSVAGDGLADLISLLVLAGLAVLLVRVLRFTVSGRWTAGADDGGAGSPAVEAVRGPARPIVIPEGRLVGRPCLTEDDLIGFGLAVEASEDVMAELVDDVRQPDVPAVRP